RAVSIAVAPVRAGRSHLYIRVADSRHHFYGASALMDLLPIAHAHGLSILGWIEPMLDDPTSDTADALAAAQFEEQGQRLDGLALTSEWASTSDPTVGQYLSDIPGGSPGTTGPGARNR